MKESEAPPPPVRSRAARILAWLCWLYVTSLVMLILLLWWGADRWWLPTVLQFGPRWACGLPLVLLIPAACFVSRRLLAVLLFSLFLVLGPLMGLCVPWRVLLDGEADGAVVRVLTLNAHHEDLNVPALHALFRQVQPDVIALQGGSLRHKLRIFDGSDLYVRRDSEFCLASRYPVREVERRREPPFGQEGRIIRYQLDAPGGRFVLFNLHFASPRDGLAGALRQPRTGIRELEQNIALRKEQSAISCRWIEQTREPFLIVGDFNTPSESVIFQKLWSRYPDAYSVAGLGWGYTYVNPWTATRIDHILAGPGWRCRACWVGPDVGSEHRPVIGDLERTGD